MSIVKSSLLKVGGIVLATTAVAVPSAIAILSNNAPESHQSNFVQQQEVVSDKPTELVNIQQEEAQHTPTEPVKAEPVAELPTPVQEPTPAVLTREELLIKAIEEFKSTPFSAGKTGKSFLDDMKKTYAEVQHPAQLEQTFPMSRNDVIVYSMTFAKILKGYDLVSEVNVYQGYSVIFDLITNNKY